MSTKRIRPVFLGAFDLDPTHVTANRGLLELQFGDGRSDSMVLSEDGHRTVAWLAPSGRLVTLLVQDDDGGDRRIPFRFGTVVLERTPNSVSVWLEPVGHRGARYPR